MRKFAIDWRVRRRVGGPRSCRTAVLAGGCFWGMESVFEHVKGVTNVVSGYAGGVVAGRELRPVSSEATGHAEAVRISYDPRQVSYGAAADQVFFTVAHDPTQVNRQGPDSGPSYRSAIFPQNAGQAAAAKCVHRPAQRVATPTRRRSRRRSSMAASMPAEAYHQDFARKHPFYPYIVVNDRPKVAALHRRFPSSLQGVRPLSG